MATGKYTSRRTWAFHQQFESLPVDIQELANEAFMQFCDNPSHTGLNFKKLQTSSPIYSARINRDYRALAVIDGDIAVWFWIGSHADYDRMIKKY